jgi:hypothetical protein
MAAKAPPPGPREAAIQQRLKALLDRGSIDYEDLAEALFHIAAEVAAHTDALNSQAAQVAGSGVLTETAEPKAPTPST